MKIFNSSALIFLTTLSLFMTGCKEETPPVEVLRPIEYTEVDYVQSQSQRTFSGIAKSEKIVDLSFRSSGILTTFEVSLGQEVKKGQILGTLDNVQARLNYEKAVTSVTSAQSQMNTAKLNLDRIRVLYEKGSASLSDFESAKNSYRNAQQSYESAKRSVNIQQEQINYGFLKAPEDGVITAVMAEVDENISPGQTVATLNAGASMEIALGLPESIINTISKGDEVSIEITSLENQKFKGVISELSPAIDVNTATYPARIKLISDNDDVKSGMAASVTFNIDGTQKDANVIRIPAKAVGEDSKGRFVFVVIDGEESAVVKKQYVEVTDLNSDGFQVKSGLEKGKVIATAGLQTLLDGQKVKLN